MKTGIFCRISRVLLFWLALLSPLFLAAQKTLPERPSPARLVNNLSKQFPAFLTANENAQLEEKLEKFARETSNQIVIVIVDDLGGYDINGFATDIIHNWGVGQAKADNGIAIIIKPTGGENERDAYIGVGYGLEGAIPDITAKHIVENEIIPQFKSGDYYNGLNSAVNVLMDLAKGEYNSKSYDKKSGNIPRTFLFAIVAMILIFVLMRIFRGGGGRGGGFTIGGGGFYGGFGGGGSWGGGGSFGGGGFGGFGGGSSGGGGGGGKW